MKNKIKSYSQFGEDKILLNIFEKKKINQGFFIEFGAWDGIHFSNCRMFYELGWDGCFIEGDKQKFEILKKNYHERNILLLNEYIDIENITLDNLIQKNNISQIDLLSIDVDGLDLTILKSLNSIRPKTIIIECNMEIPFDVNFEDINNKQIGSSLLAIKNFTKKQNYEIIGASPCNLILIDKYFNNNEFKLLNINDIFNLVKPIRLSWTNKGEIIFFNNNILERKEYFKIPTQKSFIIFQPIPKLLRSFTDVNGKGAKFIKVLYSNVLFLILRPILFFTRILNKFFKKK